MTVFCTHRELLKVRPHWGDRPEGPCRGLMVIDPETEGLVIWVAECDRCGLVIGIPPRDQRQWFDRQGVIS